MVATAVITRRQAMPSGRIIKTTDMAIPPSTMATVHIATDMDTSMGMGINVAMSLHDTIIILPAMPILMESSLSSFSERGVGYRLLCEPPSERAA